MQALAATAKAQVMTRMMKTLSVMVEGRHV
jgi:hypothetical protein